MELNTTNIIELHKIDQKLNKIEEQKGDLPALINDRENKLDKTKIMVEDCKDKISTITKEKDTYNLDINDNNSLIEKYNKQIFLVKSNKEYDALLSEIDHTQVKNKDLSDKLNKINDEINENEELIQNCEEKINNLLKNLDENKKELEFLCIEHKKEETFLLDEKNKILNKIKDKTFLNKYNNEGAPLASVSRNSCNNCFSSLPDQMIIDLKKGEKLFTCPDCGIYIYFDEEQED